MICDGDKILVEDRKNPNWPGIVFPGGHVNLGESFVDSTVREVKEETGLTVHDLHLCGVKQFGNAEHSYRYVVFMYKTSHFSGSLRSSSEGKVFWIKRQDLPKYQLAEDFASMLEVFENDDLSENYFYYDDGQEQVENK